jgi:cytoskeletal protein CcmA (bactofilin family)
MRAHEGYLANFEGQDDQPEAVPSTVIGSDIRIVGRIEAAADLMIEGFIHGDVRCRNLILGELGTIKGKIFSDRARVSGTIDGSIKTGDLTVEASAVLKGQTCYSRLKIVTGATIDGMMKCRREPEKKLKLVETAAPAPEQKIVIE